MDASSVSPINNLAILDEYKILELNQRKRMNKLGMNINKNNVNNDKTFMETKSFNNTFGTNKEKVQMETNL